jgi:hypothetical protein
MNSELKRDIFEIRFFPMPAFFDRKSDLIEALYQDAKTKQNNFEHWQLTQDRVTLFDEDKSRLFQVSFRSCAYSVIQPATDNYARDQIQKYFGTVADYFGGKIEKVQRVGFRQTRVVAIKDFDELRDRIIQEFIKTDSSIFKAFGNQIYDVQVFPIVFKHGPNKFQITMGPTLQEQLKLLWGDDAEFPEQALFLDVDYFAVEPRIPNDDLKGYVTDFLAKAKDVQSRVFQEVSGTVLNNLR